MTPKPLKILNIEDTAEDALLIRRELERAGLAADIHRVDSLQDTKKAIEDTACVWDVILCDHDLCDFDSSDVLHLLHQCGRDIPFIIVSGAIGEQKAVAAMRAGARDYVSKGNLSRLAPVVEREVREARIRQESENLQRQIQAVFGVTRDIILITDSDGRYVNANPAAYKLLGLSESEFRARNIASLFFPAAPDDFQIFWQQFLGDAVHSGETAVQLPDGTHKTFDYSASAHFLPDTHVFVLRDMTERKQAARELALAKEEAERANRKKDQFLANMSHELRTPLNAVIGYASMMKQGMAGPLTEKQAKYARNIELSGKHLLRMVNDILDVSKIEAGKIKLDIQDIALVPLVEDLDQVLNGLAEEKNVTLSFSIAPGVTSIRADASRLRQIFFNLIGNAIKFNRPGGRVTVTLKEDGDCLLCDVIDTGIGIPAEKQHELFTEFYQVDGSTKRAHEGTGLGLMLTRRLVEMHGGSITLASKEGKGSTFTFRLPMKDAMPLAHDQHTDKMPIETARN